MIGKVGDFVLIGKIHYFASVSEYNTTLLSVSVYGVYSVQYIHKNL